MKLKTLFFIQFVFTALSQTVVFGQDAVTYSKQGDSLYYLKEYEGSIIIPDSLKNEYNPFIGRVLYAGKRILEYQSETQTDSYNIEVGDIVLLPKYGDIFLENELHSMLGKKVFVCQRHRLVSTYNDLKGLCDQAGVELNINKVRIKYK